MKKRILVLAAGVWASLSLISCYSSSYKGVPSGLAKRVLVSDGVTSITSFGRLVTVNGINDTVAPVAPLSAGSSPGLMTASPSRNIVAAFDPGTNSVFAVSTTAESSLGQVHLQGPTTSIVVPTSNQLGYAAVPTATVTGFNFIGAVEVMNLSPPGSIATIIPVTNAQTIVSNSTGSQLLVFSQGSNSVIVLNPSNAVPPVDMSCLNNPPNALCTVIPGFNQPVNAVISGTTAYILNCGFECGGTQQASMQTLDLGSLTVGTPIPVNGATVALLSGSTLYVAGTGTATGPLCSSLTNPANPKTAATYCGTLDIVDLNTLTDTNFATPLAIPDGYHTRIDMSVNGQLFVGSLGCTDIGNVNNPIGEVRGCLAIYNSNTSTLIIPPDNGDVNGLQSFTTRDIEYVAEGGNLRVYDTTKNILLINDFIPSGTIPIVGYAGDVKAIDFF